MVTFLLELLAAPGRPLAALVLRDADLDGSLPERFLDRARVEDELGELPVALVLVVEVVERVVEPVLDGELARPAGLGGDMDVGHGRLAGVPALEVALERAPRVKGITRQVEIEAVRFPEQGRGRGRLHHYPAAPVTEYDLRVPEDEVDRRRPVRLAGSTRLGLVLEGQHGDIPLGEAKLVACGTSGSGRQRQTRE